MKSGRGQGAAFLPLLDMPPQIRTESAILVDARHLHAMWKGGLLGGEVMPEDVHPPISKESDELAAYFTLGMCLNYQRNSYGLWRACTAAFNDPDRKWVFDPVSAAAAPESELAEALLHHRVALQPSRHPAIWRKNAEAFCKHFGGSVRELFDRHGYDIIEVKAFFAQNARDFPYLCGPKLSNYWLYVMSQYMSWPLKNRHQLTIAPDTHVISASSRLGLIDPEAYADNLLPGVVAERWCDLLSGSEFAPIDLHTPLWLWSRAGFPRILAADTQP